LASLKELKSLHNCAIIGKNILRSFSNDPLRRSLWPAFNGYKKKRGGNYLKIILEIYLKIFQKKSLF
jgi:hypothetical protein